MEISVDTIQKCNLHIDVYSKEWFIQLVDKMTYAEFKLFCKEIMHLNEYHAHTANLWATDRPDLVIDTADVLFQIEPIDFDKEVNFVRVK